MRRGLPPLKTHFQLQNSLKVCDSFGTFSIFINYLLANKVSFQDPVKSNSPFFIEFGRISAPCSWNFPRIQDIECVGCVFTREKQYFLLQNPKEDKMRDQFF